MAIDALSEGSMRCKNHYCQAAEHESKEITQKNRGIGHAIPLLDKVVAQFLRIYEHVGELQ
jgi:hypothetical protein